MAGVGDRDGDSPPREAPICHSDLDASRVGSPPVVAGGQDEGIPMLCVETLEEVPLVVAVGSRETAFDVVAWCQC